MPTVLKSERFSLLEPPELSRPVQELVYSYDARFVVIGSKPVAAYCYIAIPINMMHEIAKVLAIARCNPYICLVTGMQNRVLYCKLYGVFF
jgi:hypothetical protein